MSVVKQNAVDFDPVFIQRVAENVRRVNPKRRVIRKKLAVTTGGIRFDHRLGIIPIHISIVKLADIRVWHYKEPDATSVYLKSHLDGDVLISMSGE